MHPMLMNSLTNCLVPYRGVKYHLKEWSQADLVPINKEELFNLRHASIRNPIEGLNGQIKKKCPVLDNMPSFEFKLQVDIVTCCCNLHN